MNTCHLYVEREWGGERERERYRERMREMRYTDINTYMDLYVYRDEYISCVCIYVYRSISTYLYV